ncbi:MAG: type II secretion system major pseudopilin GspG [Verrucomicrobiota bacterium]|nr:type II secretion system major pseudopilin GspG [Verrucomicrobiota bacterium]
MTKIKRYPAQRRGGFTLVEMLLVLVILATLAAVVVPKFAGRSKQAKVTAAKSQISSLEIAIDLFEVDMGYYPKAGNDLRDLIEEPNSSSVQDWQGPYLKKGIPTDPWGNDYIYNYPGKMNVGSYDLSSGGPDQKTGTDDDITNWQTEDK